MYFINNQHRTVRLLSEKEILPRYNIPGSAHNIVWFYRSELPLSAHSWRLTPTFPMSYIKSTVVVRTRGRKTADSSVGTGGLQNANNFPVRVRNLGLCYSFHGSAATTGLRQPKSPGQAETQLKNSKWCARRLLLKVSL